MSSLRNPINGGSFESFIECQDYEIAHADRNHYYLEAVIQYGTSNEKKGAAYDLGMRYYFGIGTPRNRSLGLKYFTTAQDIYGELSPYTVDVHLLLGTLLFAEGDVDEGILHLMTAAKLINGNAYQLLNVIMYWNDENGYSSQKIYKEFERTWIIDTSLLSPSAAAKINVLKGLAGYFDLAPSCCKNTHDYQQYFDLYQDYLASSLSSSEVIAAMSEIFSILDFLQFPHIIYTLPYNQYGVNLFSLYSVDVHGVSYSRHIERQNASIETHGLRATIPEEIQACAPEVYRKNVEEEAKAFSSKSKASQGKTEEKKSSFLNKLINWGSKKDQK